MKRPAQDFRNIVDLLIVNRKTNLKTIFEKIAFIKIYDVRASSLSPVARLFFFIQLFLFYEHYVAAPEINCIS